MLQKTLTLAVLGIAAAIPLVAGGCASNSDNPNAVTGQMASSGQDRTAFDKSGQYHPEWIGNPQANPRFYDDKGHYRPDWVNATGH